MADELVNIAKKIPIEHILASSRGGAGRAGAAGSARPTDQAVNLDGNAQQNKDGCNC